MAVFSYMMKFRKRFEILIEVDHTYHVTQRTEAKVSFMVALSGKCCFSRTGIHSMEFATLNGHNHMYQERVVHNTLFISNISIIMV